MKKIKITSDAYWIRYGDPSQSSSFVGDLAGKYLLFSSNQDLLKMIAENEIAAHGFEVAKVSTLPSGKGRDYVLCLYWHDDSRKYELNERYKDDERVSYRWWKSNRDTRAGKYSKQFLENK